MRILLTEDDDLVRMVTAELLSQLGHDVVEAENAEAAQQLLDGGTELLLTDIGLPDGDGVALARRLQALQPTLAVVIASGSEPPEPSGYIWLTKPFDESKLREALAAAIASRSSQ